MLFVNIFAFHIYNINREVRMKHQWKYLLNEFNIYIIFKSVDISKKNYVFIFSIKFTPCR